MTACNAKTTPTSRLDSCGAVDHGFALRRGCGITITTATRESELSTTVITATECCLMNNVFDFNS